MALRETHLPGQTFERQERLSSLDHSTAFAFYRLALLDQQPWEVAITHLGDLRANPQLRPMDNPALYPEILKYRLGPKGGEIVQEWAEIQALPLEEKVRIANGAIPRTFVTAVGAELLGDLIRQVNQRSTRMEEILQFVKALENTEDSKEKGKIQDEISTKLEDLPELWKAIFGFSNGVKHAYDLVSGFGASSPFDVGGLTFNQVLPKSKQIKKALTDYGVTHSIPLNSKKVVVPAALTPREVFPDGFEEVEPVSIKVAGAVVQQVESFAESLADYMLYTKTREQGVEQAEGEDEFWRQIATNLDYTLEILQKATSEDWFKLLKRGCLVKEVSTETKSIEIPKEGNRFILITHEETDDYGAEMLLKNYAYLITMTLVVLGGQIDEVFSLLNSLPKKFQTAGFVDGLRSKLKGKDSQWNGTVDELTRKLVQQYAVDYKTFFPYITRMLLSNNPRFLNVAGWIVGKGDETVHDGLSKMLQELAIEGGVKTEVVKKLFNLVSLVNKRVKELNLPDDGTAEPESQTSALVLAADVKSLMTEADRERRDALNDHHLAGVPTPADVREAFLTFFYDKKEKSKDRKLKLGKETLSLKEEEALQLVTLVFSQVKKVDVSEEEFVRAIVHSENKEGLLEIIRDVISYMLPAYGESWHPEAFDEYDLPKGIEFSERELEEINRWFMENPTVLAATLARATKELMFDTQIRRELLEHDMTRYNKKIENYELRLRTKLEANGLSTDNYAKLVSLLETQAGLRKIDLHNGGWYGQAFRDYFEGDFRNTLAELSSKRRIKKDQAVIIGNYILSIIRQKSLLESTEASLRKLNES